MSIFTPYLETFFAKNSNVINNIEIQIVVNYDAHSHNYTKTWKILSIAECDPLTTF